MVEDRVTDGERIAQLLASELTGLDVAPLDAVSVIDADSDVSPSSDGPVAYRIQYREEPVGEVRIYPDHARLRLTDPTDGNSSDIRERLDESECSAGLTSIEGESPSKSGIFVRIPSGVAVKSAVDLIRETLDGDE